ncbi:MAG: ABC transporter permease [Lachnospiraceae bacterium]|nr:ABC transporter permease [Lachnospiraceae bacterium]
MRKLNVIKGDMMFQWKYGFYGLYFLLIIIYLVIFSFFSGDVKNTIVSICVYSDPAAMGMFFMGALLLLEKSQRITSSIAISPVTPEEYILGKVLSIGIISVFVGIILMTQGGCANYLLCVIGLFTGSAFFSLCGIIVGAKIESLNQYILWTIPFEIVGFVPVILYRNGFLWDNRLMILHPGCSVMQLLEGNQEMALLSIISVIVWLIFLFWIADLSVRKMFRISGGAKL